VKGDKLNQIKEVLSQRLEKSGLESSQIPGLIKDIANAILSTTYVDLEKVNKQLRFLGWDNFQLDEHTLQLVIIAHLEVSASTGSSAEEAPPD
jgi:hypothetical protein